MPLAMKDFDVTPHLAALAADGYTLIRDFLDPRQLAAVRAGLAPHLDCHSGRNDFEGYRTERVYTLVARGQVFADLSEDPRILALLDHLLQPGYLLTASQAIRIHPGESPQPIHADDVFYRVPRPRPAISVSTIVAVDDFTASNGGTEIIAGSHRWGDPEIAGIYATAADGNDDALRRLEEQLQPLVVTAGTCIVFLGTLLHRGGANRSASPRLAFSNQYCEPWARTQENFFLGVPPALARQMSPRLQSLLGYSIWPPFMGHVTASHPLKTLQPDWVAPVLLPPKRGAGSP